MKVTNVVYSKTEYAERIDIYKEAAWYEFWEYPKRTKDTFFRVKEDGFWRNSTTGNIAPGYQLWLNAIAFEKSGERNKVNILIGTNEDY